MALSSPLGPGPFKVYAVGYTKGTPTTYAGLTIKSSGGNARFPVSQLVNTGSLSTDIAVVHVLCRKAGNDNLEAGSGLFYDTTVDNAITDMLAGSIVGTSPAMGLLYFYAGSGAAAPSATPTQGKGAFYIRTGGSGTGTTWYVWDGAVWTAVAGV